MRIVSLHVMHLAMPFRMTFRHALASREAGDSVIVRACDERGRVGFGESAPRPYVTGEDAGSVRDLIENQWATRWTDVEFARFEDVLAALTNAQRHLARNQHAAFCALELALLDLSGRAFDCCAGEALGPVRRRQAVYSGVVSADGPERTRELCLAFRGMGIGAVKIKVGASLDSDLANLRIAREIMGEGCSLRVDANAAWPSAGEALHCIGQLQRHGVEAVEQPLAADDHSGLTQVTAASPVPIVVDESLVSHGDALALIKARACDAFNIRVSKNGGMLAAARLRDLALEHGVQWMLGAQVGETAILSAAGRHLATRGEPPRWCEGSFGTLLLECDIAREDVAFAAGGTAPALTGRGLGITIDEASLQKAAAARSAPTPQPIGGRA